MVIAYYTSYPPGLQSGSDTPESIAARVAERVNQRLGGKPPAGGIYHAEGPTDEGGWWVFDVWASDADFEAFRRDILQPAMDGIAIPPPAEMRRLQVWWDSSQRGGRVLRRRRVGPASAPASPTSVRRDRSPPRPPRGGGRQPRPVPA